MLWFHTLHDVLPGGIVQYYVPHTLQHHYKNKMIAQSDGLRVEVIFILLFALQVTCRCSTI
jgi:hypothetical protein